MRRVTRIELALLLVAAVLSAGTLVIAKHANDNAAHVKRLHEQLREAAIGQCQRVKILRDQVNRSSEISFATETLVAHVLAQRSLLAHLSPADRRERVADASRLLTNVARRRYQPQTNCTAAVANPTTYRAPAPLRLGVIDGQVAYPLRAPPTPSARPGLHGLVP